MAYSWMHMHTHPSGPAHSNSSLTRFILHTCCITYLCDSGLWHDVLMW